MYKHDRDAWILHHPMAHRGLHDSVLPENSMGSFRAAAEAGYGIELDVQITKDGQIIVLHDGDTLRVTGTNLSVKIEDFAALQPLRLLKSEFGISTLAEVFREVAGKVPIFVEVKADIPAKTIGPPLKRLLENYDGPVAVMSFDPRIILWFKRYAPTLLRGLVGGTMRYADYRLNLPTQIFLRSLISVPFCRPDFVAYEKTAVQSLRLRIWRRIYRFKLVVWVAKNQTEYDTISLFANVVFEDFRPVVSTPIA